MTRRNHPHATIRCAIYTRKSTEVGLEQNFNSLDAQREAGSAARPPPLASTSRPTSTAISPSS